MLKKKLIPAVAFFLLLSILCIQSHAQKNEWNINVYDELFSYCGNGTVSHAWLYFNPYGIPQKGVTNSYSSNGSFSYAIELQGQRITKHHTIFGSGLSIEVLTGRMAIDSIGQEGIVYNKYPVHGKASLRNTYITFNPFIGKRYSLGKINFDITAGADVSFCLKSIERGHAVADNKNYSMDTYNKLSSPTIDIRPGIKLKASFSKVGLSIGYARGLTNYLQGSAGKAYTQMMRFGIGYQLF